MKNVYRKLKRFFAMFLITVTLVNTAVMDFNTTVYATEGVITMGILDALLATFGISVGLGNQSDFFSQSNFDELSTAISNGNVYHMDNYGDVDFSDSVEIAGWLDWANDIEPYLRTSGSAPIIAYGTGVKACAIELDKISYNLTGTCATTALNSYISEFIGDYNASSEALAEDIRTTFTVINGGGDPGDDDREKAAKRLKAFFAITAASMLGSGAALFPLALLKSVSESDFHEYDAAFEDICFDGAYQKNSEGQIVCDINYVKNGGMSDGYKLCTFNWHYEDSYKILGILSGENISFKYVIEADYYSTDNIFQVKFSLGEQTNLTGDGGYLSGDSGVILKFETTTCNVPIFSSYESALEFLNTGDTSGILNLNDAYKNFKTNVGTASSALDTSLNRFFGRNLTADDFISTANSAVSALDAKDGTADALPAVADVLSDGTADTDVDPDTPVETTDYTGILGRIYNMLSAILNAILAIPTAIMELPDTIWSFFQDPLAAIKAAIDAIVSVLDPILEGVLAIPIAIMELPDLVWECFQDPITSIKSVVSSIPDALKAILDAILAIPEVIMALPELVWDCFADALSRVDTMPDILDGILDGILILVNPVLGIYEVVKAIPAVLEDILDGVIALDPPDPVDPEPSTPHVGLLDGLLMLIYILFMLLKIFLHLLEFIINIFKIPADPGFITGDFRTGFDYIKSVELTGMGVSVYDFMMSLIHIMLIFGIVKVLRRRIEKIQM